MLHLRRFASRAADCLGAARLVLAAEARLPKRWQRLTVIAWHRVTPTVAPGFDPEVADTTPARFERQVAAIQARFNLVDIATLRAHRTAGRPLPPNPALLTFDDGYRDNLTYAVPILRRRRAKAVFFIATGYVTERRLFWWETINHLVAECRRPAVTLAYPEPRELDLSTPALRRASIRHLLRQVKDRAGLDVERLIGELAQTCAVPWTPELERTAADRLIMTWDEVRALAAAGMDVESHTHRHRVLSTLAAAELVTELTRSRDELERQLGRPATALAYPAGAGLPIGHPGRRMIERAGYQLGFTYQSGVRRLGRMADWLDVPRVAVDRGVGDAELRGSLAFPVLLG